MTEISKKKEEAKKAIRSLLLSAPVGLTVDELKQDYVDFLGTSLPGKDLGYNSWEDFLKDLPDVIQVSWRNGQMVLSAVASESTKHIQKLVANQKVDSKKKWGALGRSKKPALPPRHARTQQFNPRKNFNSNTLHSNRVPSTPWQSQRIHALQRIVPMVPSFIQNYIRGLVSSYRTGVPLKDFELVFHNRYGMQLDPHRIGFKDIPDMIYHLKDLVRVVQIQGEDRVITSDANMPLEREKAPSFNRTHTQAGYIDSNHSDTSFSRPARQNPSVPYNGTLAQQEHKALISKESQDKTNLNNTPGKKPGLQDLTSATGNFHDYSKNQDDSWDDSGDDFDTNDVCNVPNLVQDRMKQLMRLNSNGIFASQLPIAYKKLFNNTLTTQSYGYNSVIEFASDLGHILKIERPDPRGDWLLLPVQSDSKKLDSMKKDSTTKVPEVPISTVLEVEDSIKESIIQVLSVQTSGVILDNFLQVYQDMTGKVLDINRYSKGGLKPFLHSLSDILYIKLDVQDSAKVCLLQHNRPRNFFHLKDKYKPMAISKLSAPAPDFNDQVPGDAAVSGCYYKPLYLPPFDNDNHKFINIYLSNVINPGLMWVQLRGKETTLAMEDLMDELGRIYNSQVNQKLYTMRPGLAENGLPCAGIFPEDGNWHRVIITGVEDQLYEVFYVDYGNSCLLSIDQLKLIKTHLLELPAQAIQARLSNIQPVRNAAWKKGTQRRMLEFGGEKPLVGLVTAVQDRILSLSVVDTSGEDDVHLNDLLVFENYAEIVEDKITHDIKQTPSTHFMYGSNVGLLKKIVTEKPFPKEAHSRRYVRQAMVADLTWNLINMGGELYLTSSDVSSLFFKDNIISMKLSQSKTDVPNVVVSKSDLPELFSELVKYEHPAVHEATQLLSLYPLRSMPLLLAIFGRDKDLDEVKDTTLEILEWFNPNDPFWKGKDEEESEEFETTSEAESHSSKDSSSYPPLRLEDLQVALNILQIKRQRIITRLMDPQGCAEDVVNELSETELKIKSFQAEIQKRKEENDSVKSQPHSQSGRKIDSNAQKKNGPISRMEPGVQNPVTLTLSTSAAVNSSLASPISLTASSLDMSALLQQQMLLNSNMMAQMKPGGQSLTSPYQRLLLGTGQQPQGLPRMPLDQQSQLLQQMYPFSGYPSLGTNPLLMNTNSSFGGVPANPMLQSQRLLMQSQLLQAQLQANAQMLAQLQNKPDLSLCPSLSSPSSLTLPSDHLLASQLGSFSLGANGSAADHILANQISRNLSKSSTSTSLKKQ